MTRRAVLITFVALSIWTMAQTTQSANSTTSTQAPQAMIAPGGLSTNTGAAMIIAPSSSPLVVTPEFHLGTVNPGTGATNATPGNTAGAVNSTSSMPIVPRVITTVPLFSTVGVPVVMQTFPALENSGTAPATSAAGATALGAGTPQAVSMNPFFDRGVASGSELVAGNPGGKSLGEIARLNRQSATNANAHLYTNQDINRINSQPGLTLGGMSGAAVGTGSATQQQPSGNLPAVAEPSANPPANPGVSQPVPPDNNAPRSEAIPASPLGKIQAQRDLAQNNPPANPAGPSAQSSSPQTKPPETQRGQRQLPSAGSILPLMALVGFLAAGAGLLSR